jgi:membrane-associated phospholipid phosphatase
MEGTRSGPPPRAGSARLLLAASARPRLAAVLTGCAILVAALGALFAGQSTADAFDRTVDSPVITVFAGHRGLALWLAFPGTTIPAVVLTAALTIGCLLTGRRRGAVLALLVVPVTAVITDWLLKPLVHRTYIGQVVYPSGHTATIVALAATLTVLLLAPPRPALPRWLRIVILAVAYLTAMVVVIGVIAVRFHYFTDTVAGAAVGIGTVCALALVLDLIPPVRPSRIPRRSAAT